MLEPAGAAVAALLSMRLLGLVWTAPVFSAHTVPGSLKAGVTVLLTLLLWPSAMASGAGATVTVPAIVSELLVGITLGLGAAVFVAAAETAGDTIAVQMGLSGANVLEPFSRTQMPVLGQLLGLSAIALILAAGGHLAMVLALDLSLDALPLGGPLAAAEGALGVVRLGGTLLWLGLRFAAPVVAAMMIGNVALGVMARTVPQLNVLVVAFPLQIGIGLFVLGATLPMLASAFDMWDVRYEDTVSPLLERMDPGEAGG